MRKIVETYFFKMFSAILCIFVIGLTINQARENSHQASSNFQKKSRDSDEKVTQEKDGTIGDEKYIQQIYTYLHDEYGLSASSIAGILGNWIQESGIDPIAVQGDWSYRSLENTKKNTVGDKDIGFAQWSAKRRQQLITFANQKYHGEWWLAQCQLEFMTHQDGSFVEVLKQYALVNNKDVVQNAVIFNNEWEVSPDKKEIIEKTRGKNAQLVYRYMQKNNMNGTVDVSKVQKLVYVGDTLPY